jgi:hypothetical protein
MKKTQTLIASVVAATTLMRLGLPASASVETFTATYGSSSNPWPIGGSDFPASVALQKFDTSLGHLTDIQLILTTDGLLQADVINFGAAADFFNAQAVGTVTATAAGGAQSTVSLATTPFSGSIGAGASVQGPLVSLVGTDVSQVALSAFGDYEFSGSGGGIGSTLDVNLLGAATYDGAGPVGLFFGGDAGTYGSVEIKYDYAAVPETGSLWADLGILACGFAGLSRLSRSRFC